MSLIKDFNELHIGTKTACISIVCQIPFFFVANYLFNNKLISKISENPLVDMDFYFLGSLCFCLSLIWFLINIVLASISLENLKMISKIGVDTEQKQETNQFTEASELEEQTSHVFVISMIQSMFYLSAVTLVSYYFKHTFIIFLIFAYSYILFRIVWNLIAGFFSKIFLKRYIKS